MVDKKNAPDTPDVRDTVGYQTGTNIGMTGFNARFGNINTVTPYGRIQYKRAPGKARYTDPFTGKKYKVPKYKQVVKLSDEGQKQFDLQQKTNTNLLGIANQLSTFLGDYMGKPFNIDDAMPEGIYQLGSEPLKLGNEATEARLFELGSKRLDPKFARDKETLQSSLLARGIREGSDAWNAATGTFNEGKNDAYNQLLLTGRGQAAAETQAEYDAKLREQNMAFSQALATRSQPINEISALLGMGQVNVPQPTNIPQPQAPITDVAGLINKNWDQQFQAWQAESAAQSSLMGGLFGGISNIIASDRRIKDDIKEVGQTPDGLPIYEFRIGDGKKQAGVMAQDVEQVMPEAVSETPEGIKAVDYNMAVGAGDGTYTVKKGDNLWDIGERFNVPYMDIATANNIANPDLIQPGMELMIPGMAAPDPEAAIPVGGTTPVADALMPTIAGRPEFPGAMPAAPINLGEQGSGRAPVAMSQRAPGMNQGSQWMATPGETPEAAADRMAAEREAFFADMDARAGTGMPPAQSTNVFSLGQTGEQMRPGTPPPLERPLTDDERAALIAELNRLQNKVGTVEAGSTGGENFTPPPPTPPDPLADRVSQAFDMPQDAIIMDLMQAADNRSIESSLQQKSGGAVTPEEVLRQISGGAVTPDELRAIMRRPGLGAMPAFTLGGM